MRRQFNRHPDDSLLLPTLVVGSLVTAAALCWLSLLGYSL